MSPSGKTIGILVTTTPEHQNSYTIFRLTEAFLEQGNRVTLFFMDDGIYNVVRNTAKERLFSGIGKLIEGGVTVLICALSAESRACRPENLLPEVGLASQYELAQIASKSNRFLYFGP